VVPVRTYWASETAAVLDLEGEVTLERQRRIWWLANLFRELPGLREVVPGMNNLTIEVDPLATDGARLLEDLEDGWQRSVAADTAVRQVEIPVHYGGGAGADLDVVAAHAGLSRAQVIERHTGALYTVFFLGFLPGFAYLGGMDPRLATPRRREPRLEVPAGSVAIGGSQTAVYPVASPGGWQVIGRTDTRLFDIERDPPALLRPGDTVRFFDAGSGS